MKKKRKPKEYSGSEFNVSIVEGAVHLSVYGECCCHDGTGIIHIKEAKRLHSWLTKAIAYIEQEGK